MQDRTLRLLAALALSGAFAIPGLAAAQDYNPEEGAVWVPPPDEAPPPVQTQPPPQQPPPQQAQPTWYNGGAAGQTQGTGDGERPPGQSASSSGGGSGSGDSDGRDDHERVLNRLAVGYMGVTLVPIGTPDGFGLTPDTLTAPAIGIRYWVSELVGVDVGLGLSFTGGNVEVGSDSSPLDNAFALTVHGGLPLAIFHEQHYKFLIIPEINLGFSTGTAFGATQDQDRGRSGFIFQLGARLGGEIHFGFMDIPQLSLQASVGIYFDYTQAGVAGNRAGTAESASLSSYGLGTSVQGEPWDILLGSLTALYYF